MTKNRTIPFFLALFLVSWVLTSCATSLSVKRIAPGETVTQSEKEAFIFGKITAVLAFTHPVTGAHVELSADKAKISPALTFFQIEPAQRKKTRLETETDGSFYGIVPRGTYIIRGITYRCNYIIHPQRTFQVPLEGNAFYLGTLTIDVEPRKVKYVANPGGDPIYGMRGEDPEFFLQEVAPDQIKSIEILDEFDIAKETLVARNPDFIAHGIKKNLMNMIPNSSPSIKRDGCYRGGWGGFVGGLSIGGFPGFSLPGFSLPGW